jgi:tetratricopeptide (TPR) repeat protein
MPDEAAEMYGKSLELEPGSATAHYNLASFLARKGEFAKAEPHFRAVIEKNPSTQAYTGLGIVLWQQGREDEATTSLQSAVKADPKNAAAYDQLGTIQVQQGKLEEAASTYRSLVHNQPSAAAHQELAEVLTRLGRTDEANKELERAKALERSQGAVQ